MTTIHHGTRGRLPNRQRGISLIGVIFAMLLLSLLGFMMVSIVSTERYAGTNQLQAMSAQYLAEAGLDRALHYFFNPEQQSCGTNSAGLFQASLGQGSYKVTTKQYAPAALSLTAAMNETQDSFTVNGDASDYAPYGIVIIDQEFIECAQVSPGATTSDFKHCKRGVGNTTPAAHHAQNDPNPGDQAANVFQDFCIVNSTGTMTASIGATPVQRVVSIGFSQFDLGWAVGDQGTILQWNGAAWTAADSPTQRNLHAVQLTSLSDGFLAGDQGVAGQLIGGIWQKQRSAYVYLAESTDNTQLAVFDSDPHEIGKPATRLPYTISVPGGITELASTTNGKYLYISQYGSDAVSVVDTDAKSVKKTLTVGHQPRGIAVSPDGTKVYVVNEGNGPGTGTVSVIDRVVDTAPANDVVEATPLNLNDTANPANCVNYVPRFIALTSDGKKAFITTGTSGCLKVVDFTDGSVVGINLGDTDLWGIAMHPNDPYAYVAGRGSGQVFVIDTVNDISPDSVPLAPGDAPSQIGLTWKDGKKAYVSKNNVNKVAALDTVSKAPIDPANPDVPSVAAPMGVANSADGNDFYVAGVALTDGRINVIHLQNSPQGAGQLDVGAGETVAGGLTGSLLAAPERDFRSLSMLGPNEGWAVGSDGRLLHWTVTPPATTPAWAVQPLATMPPTPPPATNTIDNNNGTWTTTLNPTQDVYVRLNDDVKYDGGPLCNDPNPPTLGCTNNVPYDTGSYSYDNAGIHYAGDEVKRLGLRRVSEDPSDPSNQFNNLNQMLYRSFLQFDVGLIKQYALSVIGADLRLRAEHADVTPALPVLNGTMGLVLWYQYQDCPPPPIVNNQCTSAIINDSQSLNNGTAYGKPSVPPHDNTNGIEDLAMTFNLSGGSGTDRVIVPPSPSWVPSNSANLDNQNVTVETWVYFTDASQLQAGVSQDLITKGVGSAGSWNSTLTYMLGVQDGRPAFTVCTHSGGCGITQPTTVASTAAPLVANQWYFLAGTYDGQTLTIYQDGMSMAQRPLSGSLYYPSQNAITSGCAAFHNNQSNPRADELCVGGRNTSFSGLMDETRIYSRALSDEEIQEESGWGNRAVDVYNVAGSWTADTLTGSPEPAFGQSYIRSFVTKVGVPKWFSWDVTALVQDWVADAVPNNGLALRVGLDTDKGELDPGPTGKMWFDSGSAASTGNRPQLIVTYRVSRRPNLESVAMLDTNGGAVADDGWAVGEAGVIFRYDGVTKTWALWDNTAAGVNGPSLPTQGLKGISMNGGADGWAVGDAGTLLHFTGVFWEDKTGLNQDGNLNDLTAVSIAANGQGIAVGKNGIILSYDASISSNWTVDSSWSNGVSPTTANLLAIKAFSRAKGWGVGENGTILHKEGGDWGGQGTQYGTTTPNHLRGIDVLPTQTTVTDWRENY